MSGKRLALAAGMMCILAAGTVGPAPAEEKRVVDQLLDILRQNKQITDEQYHELKRKAEQERAEDLHQQAERAKPAEEAKAPAGAEPMRAYWKDGFNIATPDEAFKLKIGGRIQNDWGVTHQDQGTRDAFDLGSTDSGTEFRRARIELSGVLYKRFPFKWEYDFADGDPKFKDVYVGMRDVPVVQNVQVGHFKEPFSLEEVGSDNDTTFLERALPNAFAPSRNTGLGVFAAELNERLTWAGGVFYATDDFGSGFGSDEYDLTARLTGLPWYADGGRRLVHLGIAYSHQFRNDIDIAFSQRPEAHLYPVKLANTGNIASDGVDLVGPEAALVVGPFYLQGEYMHAFVDQVEMPDPSFGGWYVQASYLLTGESRPYKKSAGLFDRIVPKHNFLSDGGKGLGAWEIAARFSRLDLNSVNVRGGVLDDVTGGVNWYLNPNLRVSANYVRAHLESVGNSDIVEGRFQVAF